jgi:hypothetical protein
MRHQAMTLKIILRSLLAGTMLVWLVALGGVIIASDEHINRFDPSDVERLAPVAQGLLLLIPLPFAFGVWWLRRLSPGSRANQSPLGAALRGGAKALGWAYVALLAFSLLVIAAHLRASATSTRGNRMYTIGIRPQITLPGDSSYCNGSVQYYFFCFYWNNGFTFCF